MNPIDLEVEIIEEQDQWNGETIQDVKEFVATPNKIRNTREYMRNQIDKKKEALKDEAKKERSPLVS